MRLTLLILLMSSGCLIAEQAAPSQQVRRLYIDLFDRFPDVREVKKGVEEIKNYEKFVDNMLDSDEFRRTLANKVTAHYSPDLGSKRNSSGEVDPKYFKRFLRMKRLVAQIPETVRFPRIYQRSCRGQGSFFRERCPLFL